MENWKITLEEAGGPQGSQSLFTMHFPSTFSSLRLSVFILAHNRAVCLLSGWLSVLFLPNLFAMLAFGIEVSSAICSCLVPHGLFMFIPANLEMSS